MEFIMDVGTNWVRIVHGKAKGSKVKILDALFIENAEHIIELGSDKNISRLGDVIKNALKERRIRTKKCTILLRTDEVVYRELLLPTAMPKTVRKMIQNVLTPTVPGIQECYVDYRVVERFADEEGRKLKVAAYAIQKKTVLSYYKLILAAGLKPLRIDIQRNCFVKLFRSERSINDANVGTVVLLADLGGSNAMFDLIVNGEPVYNKHAAYKRLIENYDKSLGNNELMKPAAEAIGRLVSEEIYRIMQFAMSQAIRQPVTKVYLYGGRRNISGICEFISNELGLEVEILESVSGVENEGHVAEILLPVAALVRV